MSTRVPRGWCLIVLAAAVLAAMTFVLLNRAFGGPGSAVGSDRYLVHAKFADSEQLVTKSLVLVRGVKVGEVTKVEPALDGTTITFTVDQQYGGVGHGASATVGWRTAFGEAYVQLDRGTLTGPRQPSGTTIPGHASVEADEALEIFAPGTREHVRSAVQTAGGALTAPGSTDGALSTIDGVNTTVASLQRLTHELEGQGDDIAALVSGGRTVVGALADRQDALKQIVTAGAATMHAMAGKTASLRQGMVELPQLTRSAEATLRELPPLVTQAERVTRDVSAAVTEMRPALQQAGPATSSAEDLVAAVPKLAKAAEPALKDVTPVMNGLAPVGTNLDPVLRNIIPLAQWLQPRANGYAAVFANIASATAHGDSDGAWLRLFIINDELGTAGKDMNVTCGTGKPGGACFNPYPEPNDALDNKQYKAGSYPRLTPYSAAK